MPCVKETQAKNPEAGVRLALPLSGAAHLSPGSVSLNVK